MLNIVLSYEQKVVEWDGTKFPKKTLGALTEDGVYEAILDVALSKIDIDIMVDKLDITIQFKQELKGTIKKSPYHLEMD